MRSAIGGPVAPPVGKFGTSAGGLVLPGRAFIVGLWEKNAEGQMVDGIGLSISEAYPLVDPLLQLIISADGGLTWRHAADIVALAWASSLLNTGTMIGKDGVFLAIYRYDTPDEIVLKALRYTKITTEPLYFDDEQLYLDNSAVYIGATV